MRREGRNFRPELTITEDDFCYQTRSNLQRIHKLATNDKEVNAPPKVTQDRDGASGLTTNEHALDERRAIINLDLVKSKDHRYLEITCIYV